MSCRRCKILTVSAAQQLLFPDPRPLVERLGRDFFWQLPERPGVYLMRDARDTVLYVGKAKNLRKRLGSYRVANPDRMPRRHLRMLRAVERIELQECADETSALAKESELLRTLKPRFNRAGTWPAPPRFLVWRCVGTKLELAVTETPEAGWRVHGPIRAAARHLRTAIVRLLWFRLSSASGISQMPVGWFRGSCGDTVTIHFSGNGETTPLEVSTQLDGLFAGRSSGFGEWVLNKLTPDMPLFEKAVLEADIEFMNERFGGDGRHEV